MKILLICLFTLCCSLHVSGQQCQKSSMMYSDSSRIGRPFTKDPFVLKLNGRYLMYYSIPESTDHSMGWGIGIACSKDLNNWQKIGEINPLPNSSIEKKGICAPCAIIRNDTIHLFYQTYGNGASDAICHAWSVDGIHFKRNDSNPVFRPTGKWNCGRAIDAEVFLYKNTYFLYFATRDKSYQKQLLGVATTPAGSSFPETAGNRLAPNQFCLQNFHGKEIVSKPPLSSNATNGFICSMRVTITMLPNKSE